MPLDPLFNVPTEITPGASVANPVRPSASTTERIRAIRDAAYAVRDALFAAYRAVHAGDDADMLPLEDQTDLLMAVFCDRKVRSGPYQTAEVAARLHEFRALVPLLPFRAIESLETTPVQVESGDARNLLRSNPPGKIDRDVFFQRLSDVATQAGVNLPDGLEEADAVDFVERAILAARKQGTRLREYADGSESRVYLNEAGQTVYKAVPFRGELLQIHPVLEGGIQASNAYGTFLADAFGGMPLFDRAQLLATVPGVCRTELVGVTAAGFAIYKQPFLGEIEPSAAAIEGWAAQFGHASLPQQSADDPVLEDMTRLPIVAAAGADKKFILGLDLNPRNARLWNGSVVPFDLVLRELKEEEITSHPELRAAVSKLGLRAERQSSLASMSI